MGQRDKTKQQDSGDLSFLSRDSVPEDFYLYYIIHLYQHIRPQADCIFCYSPTYVNYPSPIEYEDQPWRWITRIRFQRQH